MRFLLMLFTILNFALVGCATSPNSPSKTATTDTVSSLVDKEEKQDTSEFTGAINPMSLRLARGNESCPVRLDVKQITSWKKSMAVANTCAAEGKWEQVDLLGQHMAQIEATSPWGAFYLSLAAEAKGDLARALWMSELAGKKAPQVAVILFQQARLYWLLENHERAIDLVRQTIKRDEKFTQAHLLLAKIYYRDQEFDEASHHFQIVTQLESSEASAWAGLAECRFAQGETSQGLDYLQKAIARESRRLSYQLRLAQVLEEKLKNPSAALEVYKRIRLLAGNKKLDSPLPVDFSQRVSRVEALLQKTAQLSERKPASLKQEEK